VRLLGIGVSQLSSTDEAVQLTTTGDPRWSELEGAVDAIRSRFGSEAVGSAGLVDPSAD
jgi:hypothetical protein